MQIFLLTIMGLGVLTVLIGGVMGVVAAFRQSVLWGLAYLFLPFASLVFLIIHWAESKKSFFVGLAGLAACFLPLLAMADFRENLLKGAMARLPVRPGSPGQTPAAPAQDLTAKIQAQRQRIEQLEAQFAQTSAPLTQRYQALAATRKALVPGDDAAVARFNEEAAAYQKETAAQRRMQQELTAAREGLEGMLTERSRAAAGVRPAVASAKPVIMYSTSRCPACQMAKQYFAQKGVNYETRDVEQSPAFADEFRKLGGRGVPLILVGAKKIEGFSAQAIDAAMM